MGIITGVCMDCYKDPLPTAPLSASKPKVRTITKARHFSDRAVWLFATAESAKLAAGFRV